MPFLRSSRTASPTQYPAIGPLYSLSNAPLEQRIGGSTGPSEADHESSMPLWTMGVPWIGSGAGSLTDS